MTQRLRILMTADTVGGVWTYACELARALAPLDVDITIATMGVPPTPAQAREVGAIGNAELIASNYALEWMPNPWPDVEAAGEWLLGLAQRMHPNVIHLNGYSHAVLPFGAPVVVVAHSDVCTWFRAVRGVDAPPEWADYRMRVAAGLRAANAIVAPTRSILRAILDEHQLDLPGRVIPNGRDAAVWQPGSKEPFVLAAGRLWDEAKGLDALDACASRVAWPIHVAGPTTGPCGVGSVEPAGVRLLGELRPQALADWMGHASIYALPARYEPFGLSIVEAALAGAALVLGEIDTLEEVWGDAATFIPPGDPDVLAFAINTLAADPLRRRALAASARSRALALTPQRMAAAYHELYESLAGAKRRRVTDPSGPEDEEVCA